MSKEENIRIELEQPAGDWFRPFDKFDPRQGFYPDDPIIDMQQTAVLAHHSAVLARHSSEYESLLADYESVGDNPELRRQYLTIYGLADTARKNDIVLGKHVSETTDPFAYLLGDSGVVMRTGIDMKRTETWMLPKALAGERSERLNETIEHLVSAQSNELWDALAPIRDIPLNSSDIVHWTVTEHQPAMAIETAPLGLPTMVEARAHTDKSQLSLHSIGGRVGIGFWRTEMGTRHWFALLTSIANGILAASQYSAAVTIAATEAHYKKLIKQVKHGVKPTLDYVYDELAKTFAIMQSPHHNFFQLLVTGLRDRARVRNAQAGEYALVTTPEAVIGLLKGNKDGIAFNISGPEGVARLKQEVMTKMTVYGIDIYVVPSFHMPNNRMSQVFAMPFEIGERVEFFVESSATDPDTKKFDMRTLNRRIYTREKQWMPIPWDYAVKNLSCVKDDGTFKAPGITAVDVPPAPKWWMDKKPPVSKFAEIRADADAAGYAAAWNSLYAYFPYYQAADKNLVLYEDLAIDEGTGKPKIQIIGLQLHQRGYAHNAYWMLPGKVIYRLRKPGHAVVEDSFEQHIHQVSCQYSAGAATVFPKNLVEAKNVFVAQTDTGYGIEPIKPENYSPMDLGRQIDGDIIFIAVPGPELYSIKDVPRNLNVRGVTEGDLEQSYAVPNDIHANSYPGYKYNDMVYRWSENACGAAQKRESFEGYRVIDFPVNIVARQACYQMWDPKTGGYTIYRTGNGYWKFEGTYDGASDHRNGGVFVAQPPRGKYTLA